MSPTNEIALQTGSRPVPGLGWARILAYGAPACAISGPFYFVQFYFLNFATDVLLLAPATVGLLMAGSRIWDAVSDPLAGYWSDRTRARLGRRRPWLLAGAPASAAAFVLLWSPPRALGRTDLVLWTALGLIALTTAGTAWRIPHSALGAELSDDPHARTRIYGLRFACALLGILAAFAGMQHVVNATDPRAAAAALAGGVALVMGCVLLIPPLILRERSDHAGRGSASAVRALRDVLGNPHARRLLFVWFVDQLGSAAQGAVAPFMAIYILKRPDLIGLFPAFFIGPLVASVPLWVWLSRRYGRREVWLVAMCGAAVSYGGLSFLDEGALVQAAALLACAGFWTGCGGPLGPSLLASVIDDDERRTGERKEGVYFAAFEFAEKTSSAVVVGVVGVALQLAGFEPGAEQGPTAELALRGCLGVLPAVMFASGALVFRGFSLAPPRPG